MTESYFPLDPFALMAQTQKHFGLDEDEARRATEALMPAFWAGLRRNAGSPDGLEAVMRAFTPPAFQSSRSKPANPWQAFGAWAPGDMTKVDWGAFDWASFDWGNAQAAPVYGPVGAFLARIFPNDAIRRAVLDQVAATTGIRPDALNALMPVAATLMMGQIARNFAVGPARDLLDAFMAGFARGRPAPQPTPADLMAPFAEAMSAFFTGFMRAGAPEAAEKQSSFYEDESDAPDGEEVEEADPSETTGAEGTGQDAATKRSAGGDQAHFLEGILAAGRSVQENQIRVFEQLFETLVPGEQPG
ncbi:DUF937 domain-containing protein [Breoghania sp.]|uniref:DUF937 domain-containing protein n=1 Tax=Breoghania sp. TaxID=2065378 RepID=UPI002AAA79C3|nr:DUF937 domain-containing protein [Breoghania sp.]